MTQKEGYVRRILSGEDPWPDNVPRTDPSLQPLEADEESRLEDPEQPEVAEEPLLPRPGFVPIDLEESESEEARSRCPTPLPPPAAKGRARPPFPPKPFPPQPLRPIFAYLPEQVRVFGYSGCWVEESRVLRPTLSEAGTLFIDFHQCLNRSASRPWPRDRCELPFEPVLFLRECHRAFEGIKIYLISHLNANSTLQNLLHSLDTTQGSEELLEKILITPSKTGYNGKIATIRPLAPWPPLLGGRSLPHHC